MPEGPALKRERPLAIEYAAWKKDLWQGDSASLIQLIPFTK